MSDKKKKIPEHSQQRDYMMTHPAVQRTAIRAHPLSLSIENVFLNILRLIMMIELKEG